MKTIGAIWILTATIFQMLILVSPFGFLDGGLGGNNRKECTCSPHSRATEDYKNTKNLYKYCSQIQITLNCLMDLRAKKNCSLDLFTTALHTGTVWQYRHFNCSYILKQNPSDFTTMSPVNSWPNNQDKRSPGPDQGNKIGPNRNELCVYKGIFEEPRHCGLFGDPHLKTFSDQRQTCVVKGAWSMLNNEYLAVQVTNVLIERNNPVATATSKITVMIKQSSHGCSEQKIYQAKIGHVPATFKDGTRETGPDSCKTKLVMEPGGSGVRIYICYLNTTILVRKVGKYLTFNIRTPENYVRQSRGLCVTGCPITEMIDYEGFFSQHPNSVLFGSSSPAMSKNEAIYLCRIANVTDFYYDSCVFDLISTGDTRFSEAAYQAMQDAVDMDPKLRLRRSNSIVLNHMDRTSKEAKSKNNQYIPSSSTRLQHRTFLLAFALSLLTFLMHDFVYR